MTEIIDSIEENARSPRRVSGDEGAVETHSLRDQIEADKYLRERMAGSRKRLPVRLAKIKPGGA